MIFSITTKLWFPLVTNMAVTCKREWVFKAFSHLFPKYIGVSALSPLWNIIKFWTNFGSGFQAPNLSLKAMITMKSDVDSSDSKINECTNKALRLGMNLLEPADDNVQHHHHPPIIYSSSSYGLVCHLGNHNLVVMEEIVQLNFSYLLLVLLNFNTYTTCFHKQTKNTKNKNIFPLAFFW